MKDKTMTTVMEEALEQGNGFRFLAMGRPEGPGCFCAVNDLLKYGIDNLSKQFDVTLIDCEAGPEQVNRRVVNGVDDLIIVTDASLRGARVARSIMEVIQKDETVRPSRASLVINRSNGDDGLIAEYAEKLGLKILGRIPDDRNITDYDAVGEPLIELPDTSPSVVAVKKICEKLRG